MRRAWFTGGPAEKSSPSLNADSLSLRSSASFRRFSDGDSDSRDKAFRWGWSRSERDRLVRMQAVARGWLLRRKACRIPARDVEAMLKDLHQKDKGLGRLVAFLLFILLFFCILLLESDVSFQHEVAVGIRGHIDQIGAGPEDVHLSEVASRADFVSWALSFFLSMYDGTEIEDVCNTCAAIRVPSVAGFFVNVAETQWGTEVPLVGGEGSAANDSFLFDFDNCPLCYGSDRASVVNGSSDGAEFCEMCTGFEFCFEDECSGFDEARVEDGEVKGTDPTMVRVFSRDDCGSGSNITGHLKEYGINVGLTSKFTKFFASPEEQEDLLLEPSGRGYVANRNKVVGALLVEWTYYEIGVCPDTYRTDFFAPCYKDEGSQENFSEKLLDMLVNNMTVVGAHPGDSPGEGLVYSITTDVGVYNSGLNFNLCGLLSVLEHDEIITEAVRTISLRFNTYNGQMGGLFSAVDIVTKFSLGGEVQISPSVEVFSMPPFFGDDATVVSRAVAMFAFAAMLAFYIAKDLKHLAKELRGGRSHLRISFRTIPVSSATIVHFGGDAVFAACLAQWISIAMTSSTFELEPTLDLEQASEQVRQFSQDLAAVALARWKRDALAVAGSMIGLARLFLMLRFHPRLSLVTDVLAASAVHLVHFFIMFFTVVAVYSNLGWVIFGPTSDLFATWTESFVTMTRIALGEFDDIYPGLVEINQTSALIIIVTYQTLQFILLLNIVISILLDAFQVVQDKNASVANNDTLLQTITTTLGRWRIHCVDAVWTVCYHGSSRVSRARPWTSGVRNPMNDSIKRRWRQVVHGTETATTTSSASTSAVALLGPRDTPPLTSSDGNLRLSSGSMDGAAVGKRSAGGGEIAFGRDSRASTRQLRRRGSVGLTRGQRIAASHRHYDMRTAAEVLRRSSLPESAVRRKMRQIIGARLGSMSFGSGSGGGGGDSNGSMDAWSTGGGR